MKRRLREGGYAVTDYPHGVPIGVILVGRYAGNWFARDRQGWFHLVTNQTQARQLAAQWPMEEER